MSLNFQCDCDFSIDLHQCSTKLISNNYATKLQALLTPNFMNDLNTTFLCTQNIEKGFQSCNSNHHHPTYS